MARSRNNWLIPLLLAAGAAGALIYYLLKVDLPEPAPADSEPAPELSRDVARPGPANPLEAPDAGRESPRNLVPLPPLSDSDGYFRLELIDVFGKGLETLLADQALIEKFVATIDNLPRKHVAERLRPLGGLPGTFTAETGGSESWIMATANAERYAPLVDMLAAADIDSLVDAYRRYYPLFQQAYVELGYPDGYFNDRFVEVIDHLLAAPDVTEPIVLVRPHVLYEYADPRLEALSAGQKLMLRIGTENRARVEKVVAEFRSRIAAGY